MDKKRDKKKEYGRGITASRRVFPDDDLIRFIGSGEEAEEPKAGSEYPDIDDMEGRVFNGYYERRTDYPRPLFYLERGWYVVLDLNHPVFEHEWSEWELTETGRPAEYYALSWDDKHDYEARRAELLEEDREHLLEVADELVPETEAERLARLELEEAYARRAKEIEIECKYGGEPYWNRD